MNTMARTEFNRTINASDLQEWIMNAFPDWCEGDIRLIYDHIDDMPTVTINDHPDEIKVTNCNYKSSAQPEKRTEERTETHACDCISRQSAIEAYGDWYVEEGTAEGFIGTVKQLLEGLPSAQPDACENTCEIARKSNDMISRQSAIEAIRKLSQDDGYINLPHEHVTDVVRALSSAQPTYTDAEIQKMQDIEQAQIDKAYQLGYEDGKEDGKSHWIPCSSGEMPEELAEVNITWVNRDPEPYYAFLKDKPFTGSAVYCKGRWYWYSAVCTDYLREYGTSPNDIMDDAIEVIAWMPMPEPWEGDAE